MSRHTPDTTPDPFEADDLRALEAALAGTPPHSAEDREWADLVAMVREEPPRRDPIARVALDHKVAAGFAAPAPAAKPKKKERRFAFRPALAGGFAIAAAVAMAVVVIGLNQSSDQETSYSQNAASAPAVAEDSASSAGASAAPASPPSVSSGGRTGGSLTQRQSVIRSTELDLTTTPGKVQEAADGIVQVTGRVGGIVEDSQVDVTARGGSASFTLRVPSSQLARAVTDLSALADVRRVSSDTQNVTDRAVSLKDQLADARSERDALSRALDRTSDADQIASLRRRLTAARQEVERRRGAVISLSRETDRARIDVDLTGRAKGAAATDSDDDSSWGPGDALRDAGAILAVTAGVAIVVLAILLPLGLLGGAGSFAAGSFRRRRREAALDTA